MELAIIHATEHEGEEEKASRQEVPQEIPLGDDDVHRPSPGTVDDLDSSLKIVRRRKTGGGLTGVLCRAVGRVLGRAPHQQGARAEIRVRANSLRDLTTSGPTHTGERLSNAGICEGFVVANLEGDPLFNIKERLGSGAFGVCYRGVRHRPQWERERLRQERTTLFEVGNPLCTGGDEGWGEIVVAFFPI